MKKWLVLIFSLSLIQLLFSLFKLYQAGLNLPDFANFYYRSGKDLQSGLNPYTKTCDPIAYPPPVLAFFYGLSVWPIKAVALGWTALSLAALAAAVCLMGRSCQKRLIFLAMSFLAFPVKFTLGMGQINHFILLFIVLNLIFYLKKKDFLAGIFLALALLFKLFPLLLIAFFLRQRKWRLLGWTLTFLSLALILSYFVLGKDIFFSYFTVALPGLINSFGNNFYYNQSLSAFFTRLFGTGLPVAMIYYPAAVSIFILSFYRLKSLPPKRGFALILTTNVLLQGIAWQHHLVFLLPAMIVIYQSLIKNKAKLSSWLLLASAYGLISVNIKNPLPFMSSFLGNIILSHGTIGIILLWLILIKQEKPKVS